MIHTPTGPAEERRRLTYDQYLRLVGLLALATDHRKALDDIERSARALLGDEPAGHTSDVVWGGLDTDAWGLLTRLNIAVLPREE